MILPLPRLRALKLDGVNDLKIIWKTSSLLLQSPLFEYLETLEVTSCKDLIDLTPSSASFQNLTTLKVYQCNTINGQKFGATCDVDNRTLCFLDRNNSK